MHVICFTLSLSLLPLSSALWALNRLLCLAVAAKVSRIGHVFVCMLVGYVEAQDATTGRLKIWSSGSGFSRKAVRIMLHTYCFRCTMSRDHCSAHHDMS